MTTVGSDFTPDDDLTRYGVTDGVEDNSTQFDEIAYPNADVPGSGKASSNTLARDVFQSYPADFYTEGNNVRSRIASKWTAQTYNLGNNSNIRVIRVASPNPARHRLMLTTDGSGIANPVGYSPYSFVPPVGASLAVYGPGLVGLGVGLIPSDTIVVTLSHTGEVWIGMCGQQTSTVAVSVIEESYEQMVQVP